MGRRLRDSLPLLPFLIVVVIFLIIPTVTVVVSSVYADGVFSLDRIAALFTGTALTALANSVLLSGATALLGAFLGAVLAFAVVLALAYAAGGGTDRAARPGSQVSAGLAIPAMRAFSQAKKALAAALEAVKERLGLDEILSDPNVCKVSVIGIGMRSHAGVAQTMFRVLGERGINIQAIATSEIKISVLIAEEYTELAVRVLHTAYGLDG